MSKEPENGTPKIFKIKRTRIALNVLLQLLAVLLVIVMVNYMAFHHYKRWDYSRTKKYALSSATRQVLGNLKKPVKVTVFFTSDPNTPGSDIYADVLNLLKEYQYAGNQKIDMEVPVNPFRDFTRARELQAKYKFGANENIVILDCEGRTKFVTAIDMANYDTSGVMYGKPPRLTAFKGEQALTAAILEVTEEKQSRVYLLAGHGEPDLKSDSMTTIREFIGRQNIQLNTLNLMDSAVPPDAKTVLIIGPKFDFSEREMMLLEDYWAKKGRLFVAEDPAALTPRFTAFLNAQGVKLQDDRILTLQKLAPGLYNVLKDVTAVFLDGNPITSRLKGVNTQFFGGTQSILLDQKAVKESKIHLQSLIEAAEGFWGETDYNVDINAGGRIDFDPKKDHVAPLTIAALVEKGGLNDPTIQVDSSRMIVVANAEFFNNDQLTQPNVDFTMSSLNWLLSREELIGISPKSTELFSLNLTEAQLSRIFWIVLGLIPGTVAVVGILGWLKRR
ncbi:MAG: GldG family protein [Verrucomicrobiota bacterium]